MNRTGLGCMGMARRNEESSIRTVDTALDHGVTMFMLVSFITEARAKLCWATPCVSIRATNILSV